MEEAPVEQQAAQAPRRRRQEAGEEVQVGVRGKDALKQEALSYPWVQLYRLRDRIYGNSRNLVLNF